MNDESAPSLRLGAKQSRIVASAITLVALCVLFVLGAAVFWLALTVVDRYRLVLLPPIVAVILANVVQPVFDATRRALWTRLERVVPPRHRHIPKGVVTTVAIAAAVLCILLPLALFLWLCGSLLVGQLVALPDAMPDVGAWLHAKAPQLAAYIDQHGWLASAQQALQSQWLSESALSVKAMNAAGIAISNAAGIVQSVAAWLMVPVYMVIYLASRPLEGRDFAKMMVGVTARTRENIRFLIDEFIRIVVYYFRGQVLVAIIEGPLFGLGFQYVAGIPNGLLLGVAVGLVNIAPYMGTVFVMPIVCVVVPSKQSSVSNVAAPAITKKVLLLPNATDQSPHAPKTTSFTNRILDADARLMPPCPRLTREKSRFAFRLPDVLITFAKIAAPPEILKVSSFWPKPFPK